MSYIYSRCTNHCPFFLEPFLSTNPSSFNRLIRFVIAVVPKSICLLILCTLTNILPLRGNTNLDETDVLSYF